MKAIKVTVNDLCHVIVCFTNTYRIVEFVRNCSRKLIFYRKCVGVAKLVLNKILSKALQIIHIKITYHDSFHFSHQKQDTQ